eukprot:SAG11_NODE_38216_length_253_cov_0.675325_1_plen_71_part_10
MRTSVEQDSSPSSKAANRPSNPLAVQELVTLLGLPSAKSARNKREMVLWLLPRARAQWNDVANAMAVHGKA